MKKVLALTTTCNRFNLTSKYLPELRKKGGYLFMHVVVDNGSTDGTVAWLKTQELTVLENKENIGIVRGLMQGYAFAIKNGFIPDYVVKYDDDCEIITPDILKEIINFMEATDDTCCVAPIDLNIDPDYVPKINEDTKIMAGYNVRVTTHIGGMLAVIPRKAMEALINAGGIEKDVNRGHFWIKEGFKCVYLRDLKVKHQGNSNQVKKYKF